MFLNISFGNAVFATSYTWTGTTSTAWGTSTNWSPSGVPGSADNVTINSSPANTPVVSSNVTITNFTMSAGTLTINQGVALNVTGTTSITGGSTVINGSGKLNIGTSGTPVSSVTIGNSSAGPTLSDTLYINSNAISIQHSKFTAQATIKNNNTATSAANGGNVFSGTTSIEAAGTAAFQLANTIGADTIKGDVTFIMSSSGNLEIGYSYSCIMQGNIIFQSTTGTGSIRFGAATGVKSTLSTGKTFTAPSGSFTSGTLGLINFIQNGSSTSQSITLTGTAVLSFNGSEINGILTAQAANVRLNGAHFKNRSTFNNVNSGIGTIISNGGNTFDSATTITNSGTITLKLSDVTADVFNSDVTISNSSSAALYINSGVSSTGNTYNGNVTFTNSGTGGVYPSYTGSSSYNGNITFNCSNWNSAANANVGNGIMFGWNGGTSTLASGKTLNIGSFTIGNLNVGGITQMGTTAQSITLTGTARLWFGSNAVFNAQVTAVTPQLYIDGTHFKNKVDLTKNGATANSSWGGVTFDSTTVITNSGSNALSLGTTVSGTASVTSTYGNDIGDSITIKNTSTGGIYLGHDIGDTYNGNLTLNNSGTGGINVSYSGTNTFNGNIIVKNSSWNGSSNGILFGANSGTSTLASGKTITAPSGAFTIGYLQLRNFTQLGNTAQNITLTSTGYLYLGSSSTFNGAVTATSPQLAITSTHFANTATLTKNGATSNTSGGGNTFDSTVTITNSGSGDLILSTAGDTYNDDVNYTKSGSGAIKAAYTGTNLFYGNITLSGSVTFGDNGGTVSFEGANSQTFTSSSSVNIAKLKMNKVGSTLLTMNANPIVTTSLTFVNGIMKIGFSNLLQINDNAVASGASINSFVDGNIHKVGNDAFIFPLGSGSIYMPLGMTAPPSTGDVFTASAYNSATAGTYDPNIKSIIPASWTFSTSGTSSVQITLYWNSTTPKTIFPDAAHVVYYNGSRWQDKGANSLSYTYLQGNVTSNTIPYTVSGYFTLGFSNANPASCTTCDTLMNWVTVRNFDEYGRVIDDKKMFADNLGRTKQAQQRNLVANKILAQATIYDTYGRAGLSTLPAPITDSTCFAYNSGFITNGSSNPYGHKDFDSTSTLNNPSSVSTSSPLGSYYSNSNSYEAYVATSGHPFVSTDYNNKVIEGVTRSSGPADSLRMGKGHEKRSVTLPVYGELSHYYTLKKNYFVSGAGSTFDGEVLKTVAKDENGTEQISYTNKSGQTIAQCLAGTSDSLLVNVQLKARYSSYTLKVPTGATYSDIAIQNITNGVEIYRYSTSSTYFGAPGSNPYTTLSAGDSIRINCNSPFSVTYNVTDASGFSRNKVCSVELNYLNYSTDIHLQAGHHLSVSNSSGSTANVGVINLETGATVYIGAVSSFSSSSSIAPGFYRVLLTFFTGVNTNASSASSYINISYYNKYGNYTYSYYDNAGRLLGQTAPNGVVRSDTTSPKYTSTYTYNTLGWTLSSKDPDRGLTYYVYQKDGSLRFSQDSLQRAGNKFSYINYDNIKRVIETGEYASRASQTPNDLYFQNMKSNYQGTSIPSGYSNIFTVLETNSSAICNGNCNTVSSQTYDSPDGSLSGIASGYTQRNVNGKTSKSSNANITSWYSYDERGRVEWTVQQLAGTTSGSAGGDFSSTVSDRVKTMDYVYDVRSNLLQTMYQKNVNAERLDHYYTYDVMQRLYKVETSLSGGGLIEHAQLSYYLHGPLKRTELGDTLQGLDYVYTVDGMLKAINHPYLDTSDMGKDSYSGAHSHFAKDVFGMMLEYYENDYVRDSKYQSTTNLTSSGYSNYFNGNIRSWTWNQSACTTGTALAQYAYKYDSKYQLTQADYGAHNTSTNQYTASSSNIYQVFGITYDLNGNLKTLRRNDQTGSAASKDYINYIYNTNLNTLQKTQNSGSSDTRNYKYDVIGRMISSTNSLGSNPNYISYDYTGKVTGIYKDSTMAQALATFFYDEKGHRIRKTQYSGSSPYSAVSHTYYINDAQGTVLSVYNVNVGSSATQAEINIYGTSRIGHVDKTGTTAYLYDLKDHLGNVRATVWKNPSTHVVEVVNYVDFYPHGGTLPGRSPITSVTLRNFCYQGEYAEKDGETGYVNFDLRMFDPDITTWSVPDPMYQDFSPYIGMGNNPIVLIDPTGGEIGMTSMGQYCPTGGPPGYDQSGGGDQSLTGGYKRGGPSAADIAGVNGGSRRNGMTSIYPGLSNNNSTGNLNGNTSTMGNQNGDDDGGSQSFSDKLDEWDRAGEELAYKVGMFLADILGAKSAADIVSYNMYGVDIEGKETSPTELTIVAAIEIIPIKVTKIPGVKQVANSLAKAGFKTLAELGLKDGMKMSSSKALQLGAEFLGKGYKELVPGSGRFVSSDGTRAFRMGINDITGAHGGGNHVNFETLIPNPDKPGKMMVDQNMHIFITP